MRTFFLALLAFFLVPAALAATFFVDGSSASGVNSALNNAKSGDTVTLTNAGWATGTVTIPGGKNITLDGGGLTALFAAGQLFIPSSPANWVRVTHFTFAVTSSGNRYAITTALGSGNMPWRMDHCVFTTPVAVANVGVGSGPGLMDHIYATNMPATIQFIEPNWLDDFNTPGANSGWTDQVIPGGTNALYIEDSTFSDPSGNVWDAACIFQLLYGARVVLRNSTISAVMPEVHGNAAPVVGGRWWEFYNNTFVSGAICIRDGSGYIYNNSGNTIFFTMVSESTGYPADYQVGRGQNQTSWPAHLWGNSPSIGNPHLNEGGDCSVATAGMVAQNRDVFFDSSGTSFPGSPISGQGFWRTDLNTLYVYSNATWVAQYHPLVYPHPLQGAASNPSINIQPQNQAVSAGQTATFSVTASGNTALSYQWNRAGTNVTGATQSSYTTPATALGDNGQMFYVAVSDTAGTVNSSSATLTVNPDPGITVQPQNQTVNVGQAATFSVAATGQTPLSYQWNRAGTNVTGATQSSYTTPATAIGDNGQMFYVTVSDTAGTVKSSSATLKFNPDPGITVQPQNQTVNVGQAATFNVAATGQTPLSYQWNRAGTNVTGATQSSYTTPATALGDSGQAIYVTVTDTAGSLQSSTVTLTVNNPGAVYVITRGQATVWNPAGMDTVGGIPATFSATNTVGGLHPWGTANDAVTLQNAINAAASNTVLFIPAGTYLIDLSTVTDPWGSHRLYCTNSGVVIRGAQPCLPPWYPNTNASETVLVMSNASSGTLGDFAFVGGRKSGPSSWVGGTNGPQSGIGVTNGYTLQSASLSLSNVTGLGVGSLISIYENKDSAWVDDKGLVYLGEDSAAGDPHVWQQYSVITNITGTTVGFTPPLYQVTPSPTGVMVRGQKCFCMLSGLENLRVVGCGAGEKGVVAFDFVTNCWMQGVEVCNAGGAQGGSPQVWTRFSYANSYFRNYCHLGTNHDSGSDYGLEFYNWNSRHKIENNIVQETRHAIVFEGGGAGCAILYNYLDSNWESVQGQPSTPDATILSESAVLSHGAHPHMNLWEGNHTENFEADYTQGSSSHNVVLRNSIQGFRRNYPLSSPWFWNLIDIQQYCYYYVLEGNIIGSPGLSGLPGWQGGNFLDNGTAGNVPQMFRFGYASDGGAYADTTPYNTVTIHGNYDFVTGTIANWASGNHGITNSLYYGSKPAYFGSRPWPPYDPSNVSAAQVDRTNIPAGFLYVTGSDPFAPAAPTISTQPQSVTMVAGTNATFSVTASGTAPLSYQWARGSSPINGATGSSYTLANAQVSDSGAVFSVTITNTAGSVTSQTATLTVLSAAPAPPTGLRVVATGP